MTILLSSFGHMLNELPLFEKLLFKYSRVMTLSDLAKRSRISYNTIRVSNNKIKEKLGLNKKI